MGASLLGVRTQDLPLSAPSTLAEISPSRVCRITHACTGYAQMIQFQKEDFLCVNCGDSPKYIVFEGKTDG